MISYNILVCEDSQSERENIQLFIGSIFRDSKEIRLNVITMNFAQVWKELESDFDLLILDLHDKDAEGHKNIGIKILMHNHEKKQIPTIVYTNMGDQLEFEEDIMKAKYPFLKKKITKIHDSYDNLKNYVKGYIISNLKKQDHYRLYNENDISLKLSIKVLGNDNFGYILYQIYEDIGKKPLTVYPMKSGLSGAILFKLKYENKTYILKLSDDVAALTKEHKNAMGLYHDFPNHLINRIDPKEYHSFEKNALGILIKNVDDAKTFFDILLTSSTNAEIEKYLSDLYLDGNGLKDHFGKMRGEKKDWAAIFENMDSWKLVMVEKSLEELKPIIEEYYGSIDIDDFRCLALEKKYKALNIEKLLDDKYKKYLVLSHGDFHAKNLMVQNGHRPVIIDTGLLGYKHWSLDISRLIANIFIMGLDHGTIKYFELDSIKINLEIANCIIRKQPITDNTLNSNVICALNWLITNIEEIYGDLFALYEFQLGLMKEFLQVAYRFDTIPPNKRALALIIAQKCLIEANENVKK